MTSPFFHPGTTASAGSLAILQLRRDHLLPTILQQPHQGETEYEEGHVVNTRFGSYPHSTLIDIPWGSQVLASKVDTGSRGRDGASRGKKRKLVEVSGGPQDGGSESQEPETPGKQAKAPVTAASGFAHILPPTPETWTVSLPHRTQVVYTPDYSFILQKLQVRPGSVIIEAGAGSGSFTHAAARAVFDGYAAPEPPSEPSKKGAPQGKVFSFEYHEPRAKQLQAEIKSHGLSSIVTVTHRDVYGDGFLLPSGSSSTAAENTATPGNANEPPTDPPGSAASSSNNTDPPQVLPHTSQASPNATQVFLDLPAPWLALPHLSRQSKLPSTDSASTAPTLSPLDPQKPVHLCCFLPCIEQAQRTISALRTHGWLEVSMFELIHRRLDVRRERVGLNLEGLRGVNAVPATVDEAVQRLVEVEKVARLRTALASKDASIKDIAASGTTNTPVSTSAAMAEAASELSKQESRAARLARIAEEAKTRKPWEDSRVVVRTEPEIKTHTSYLVFALLPVEWTEEMEAKMREKWVVKVREDGEDGGGKRQRGRGGGKRGGKKGDK